MPPRRSRSRWRSGMGVKRSLIQGMIACPPPFPSPSQMLVLPTRLMLWIPSCVSVQTKATPIPGESFHLASWNSFREFRSPSDGGSPGSPRRETRELEDPAVTPRSGEERGRGRKGDEDAGDDKRGDEEREGQEGGARGGEGPGGEDARKADLDDIGDVKVSFDFLDESPIKGSGQSSKRYGSSPIDGLAARGCSLRSLYDAPRKEPEENRLIDPAVRKPAGGCEYGFERVASQDEEQSSR